VITVLVADDSAAFRFGLRTMLQSVEGVTVVGEAASGDEAVVHTARLHPDVVLMDLDMASPEDGVAATERIAEQSPHVGVLVLTMSAQEELLGRALRAGARGYLVKGAAREEIERAVRTVAHGGLVVGASLAGRAGALLAATRAGGSAEAGQATPFSRLSQRERQVLALMCDGLDNPAIARRLVLSPKTVRNVVSSIFAKVGSSDRAEVVALARRCR
jgi:DNA-binding NarL/FixJ family response regulator